MDTQQDILIITRLKYYSDTECIYKIIPELSKHFNKILIADMDDVGNVHFMNRESKHLYVKPHDDSLSPITNKTWFQLPKLITQENFPDIVMMLADGLNTTERINISKNLPNKMIINNPLTINKIHNKKYLLEVQNLTPEVQLVSNTDELEAFLNIHKVIVLKPLDSNGGKGLIKIDSLKSEIFFENKQHEYESGFREIEKILEDGSYIGMRFLNGVDKGDKRIVVCNKKVISTLNRKPAEGNWLCNLNMGGSFELDVRLEDEEIIIVNELNKLFDNEEIFIYGIDTLYDETMNKRVLSEINISNVGGIVNKEIAKAYAEELIKYIKNKRR